MDLNDQVVVITGAANGLGKELALLLADEGCRVVASDIDEKRLESAFSNKNVLKVVTDVTDEKSVTNLATEAEDRFGRINCWINNVAIWLPHSPIEDQDSIKVRKMFEVNFFGTFYGSKEAVKRMKKQNEGLVCNIISTSAMEGRPNSSGYCASKFAVRGLTLSLALELADKNISVFGVYPDKMKTNLFNADQPKDYHTYMEPKKAAKIIVDNFKSDHPKPELIIR